MHAGVEDLLRLSSCEVVNFCIMPATGGVSPVLISSITALFTAHVKATEHHLMVVC